MSSTYSGATGEGVSDGKAYGELNSGEGISGISGIDLFRAIPAAILEEMDTRSAIHKA